MQTGYFYILGAGFAWSMLGIFINGLYSYGFVPMQIVSVRATVAAVVLTIALLFFKADLLKIKLRDLWLFIGTGLFSIIISNYASFTAFKEVGISVGIILLYTSPVFVTLMAALIFKEPLTKRKVMALVMALIGCALVSGIAQPGSVGKVNFNGLLMGLLSAFGYALYSILGIFAIRAKYHPLTITVYTFISAAVCGWFLTSPVQIVQQVVSIRILLLILGISVLCSIVPYFLYAKGLESVEASKASILVCVEPAMAIVFGVTLYNEPFTFFMGLGVSAILGAILLLNDNKPKMEEA